MVDVEDLVLLVMLYCDLPLLLDLVFGVRDLSRADNLGLGPVVELQGFSVLLEPAGYLGAK